MSIPDRWDDDTLINGYPEWRGNGRHDSEHFTDVDGDEFWQPGEIYEDRNGNNIFDSEFYHPLLTGYLGSIDHGVPLVVWASGAGSGSSRQSTFALDIPSPNHRGGGAELYKENLVGCNSSGLGPGDRLNTLQGNLKQITARAVTDLIMQDPEAYWDDASGSVLGSRFAFSPRLRFFTLHDPRPRTSRGRTILHVSKLSLLFVDRLAADGSVIGRFMGIRSPRSAHCSARTSNPITSSIETGDDLYREQSTTWGRLKAERR